MSARMIMKNDYSKRSMPLNWGVSKSLTTSLQQDLGLPCRWSLYWATPTILLNETVLRTENKLGVSPAFSHRTSRNCALALEETKSALNNPVRIHQQQVVIGMRGNLDFNLRSNLMQPLHSLSCRVCPFVFPSQKQGWNA